jgi:hypothetical protein
MYCLFVLAIKSEVVKLKWSLDTSERIGNRDTLFKISVYRFKLKLLCSLKFSNPNYRLNNLFISAFKHYSCDVQFCLMFLHREH